MFHHLGARNKKGSHYKTLPSLTCLNTFGNLKRDITKWDREESMETEKSWEFGLSLLIVKPQCLLSLHHLCRHLKILSLLQYDVCITWMCQKRFTFITYYVCSKYDGSHKVRYNLLHQYLQIVSYVPGTGDTIINRQQTSEGALILTEITA